MCCQSSTSEQCSGDLQNPRIYVKQILRGIWDKDHTKIEAALRSLLLVAGTTTAIEILEYHGIPVILKVAPCHLILSLGILVILTSGAHGEPHTSRFTTAVLEAGSLDFCFQMMKTEGIDPEAVDMSSQLVANLAKQKFLIENQEALSKMLSYGLVVRCDQLSRGDFDELETDRDKEESLSSQED